MKRNTFFRSTQYLNFGIEYCNFIEERFRRDGVEDKFSSQNDIKKLLDATRVEQMQSDSEEIRNVSMCRRFSVYFAKNAQ